MSSSVSGPSLPPKVNGELIGTLTISLQECTLVDAFARIQFWGEQAFSDLHLHKSRESNVVAGGSDAVDYPLVGSTVGLCKYMKDASPLRVSFLRNKNGLDDAPELVGHASIPDICIADVLKLQTAQANDDTPKTIRLSLRRKLQILSPDSGDADDSNICIGEALFELLFRVIVMTPSAASCQQVGLNQVTGPPLFGDNIQDQLPTSYANHAHSSRPQPSDNSLGLQSDDLGTNNSELINELLDLCADDMTMPTTASVDNSIVDPYDMWISRIVESASSPPAEEFPSLVSAGSRQSSVLRKVGLLKLEVDDLTLFTRAANGIKGKNDFYVQYHPPPHAFEPDKAREADESVEFVVCEHFGTSLKTKGRGNPIVGGKNAGKISLMTAVHSKQMHVEFKEDDSVRDWLDGTMEFSLLYSASKPVHHSKLPRVAMLASDKRKEASSATTTTNTTNLGRVHLAKASFKLRNVILSDKLTANTKLDLLLTNEKLQQDIGAKVGSLSVNLGLHLVDHRSMDSSVPGGGSTTTSSTAGILEADRDTQIYMRGPQTSSSSTPLTPHPISVFLSNYIGATKNATTEGPSTNVDDAALSCRVEEQQRGQNQTSMQHDDVSHSDDLCKSRSEGSAAPLKPVKAPPVWLDIRVTRISNVDIGGDVNGKRGCLQLSVSFSEPVLSFANHPTQQNGTDQSASVGPQMLCTQETVGLRGDGFVSVTTTCSWQVALDAERNEEDKGATATLHVWHCINSDGSPGAAEKSLVGLVKIPLSVEASNGVEKICDYLPSITADGSFDVLHPESHSPIGKVQATVAVGMLRQIRGFSAVCKSAVDVQRWWRRKTSSVSKEEVCDADIKFEDLCEIEGDTKGREDFSEENKLSSPTEERAPRDYDTEYDTVHAGFGAAKGRKDDPTTSSPDSLFEEWSQSQQSSSLPCKTVQFSGTSQLEDNTTSAEPPCDDIQHENDLLSVDLSRISESCRAGTEATTDGNDNGNITGVDSSESKESDAKERNQSLDPPNCSDDDHFDVLVRLEKISGLREILSSWCYQQGASLLPASGVFISCSIISQQENAIMSQHEELCKLCLDAKLWHSKLMSLETMSRDVEFNMESTLSMPTETNAKMILSQTLEVKLWFVPIITTTVAEMIDDGGKPKDIQSLNGCTVIAIAKCPLYNLYTPNGCHRGRIPCCMVGGRKKDRAACSSIIGGYITTTIRRIDIQNSPSSAGQDDHAMSTLKPLNLDASTFSLGLGDDCTKERIGIDPPEENEPSCNNRSCNKLKRKMEQRSAEPREVKRYRVKDDNPDPSFKNEPLIDEEPEVLEDSEDADDALTYRSLTSVMESLVNINSHLQCVNSFNESKRKSDIHVPRAEGPGDEISELNSDSVDCDCACRQEPSKDETPPKYNERVSVDNAKTCEKGSSPMSMAYHCADATTSCGVSLSADVDVGEAETSNRDRMEAARGADCDAAVEPESDSGQCKSDETKSAGSELPDSAERIEQPVEQSTNSTGGRNRRSHEASSSRLYPGRGPLDGLPKRYSFLASAPPYSRGIIFNNRGERRALSPINNFMSPPGRGILSTAGKGTWTGKNISTMSRERPNFDKDRLERIFRSSKSDT